MKKNYMKQLENCPVIAAVKNREQLEKCFSSQCEIIFLLFGDICNITENVQLVKDSGKFVVVHIDLISGLSSKEIAVDFIRRYTKADGIISTRPLLIKRAGELGLFTVLRVFVIDSMAISNIKKEKDTAQPDVIEILPGLMPKIITGICKEINVPIIAGGLISDKEDIMSALKAGAVSISTTNEAAWFA